MPAPCNKRIGEKQPKVKKLYFKERQGENMKTKNVPEITITDNTLDNIIKMAPYLDEKSQDRVFGMMLEAVKSLEDNSKKVG